MDSTGYRDAILNISAILKYVILLSLEQGVLISLEYDSLIYLPHKYPFRAPQHCQSKIRLIWDAYLTMERIQINASAAKLRGTVAVLKI